MTSNQFEPLRKLWLASLTTPADEPQGILHLDVNIREVFKCDHVKPTLDDYEEFLRAIEDGDDDQITDFEEDAERTLQMIEEEFVQWVKRTVGAAGPPL